MFKRASNHYGHASEPDTPGQRAARVWDDRIGSARVQARNWRLMAFGSLVLSAGLATALTWQSTRGTIVPWVVQVDAVGQTQTVAPAKVDYKPTDPQIAYQLSTFISDVRSISADPVIVRQNWLHAYNFMSDKGAQALNGYAQTNDPFARVGTEQVAVDVTSVIRASSNSFRVTWTERTYANGQLVSTARWSAILTTIIDPPRDPERLRKNPLGVYITALDWAKEVSL
ncbi:hypothetical protein MMA231_04166 (plasmid) [Asticcacaulis sp. MM231]|uniref:conjugal transfer protein TrbF n=1 Tax=Asticcacaulis sp. MM231 TaxID=3157666 RepID=UPI0032D59447